jgi:O-antigen/teichoic acid export membrane protein
LGDPASAGTRTTPLTWLRRQVPAGSFGAIIVRLANPALAFVVTIVLARALGAGAYGDYMLAVTVVSMLILVALVGLETLTPRTLGSLLATDPEMARRFLRWSTAAVLATAVLAAVLAVAVLAWNPMRWTAMQVSTTLVLLAGLPFAAGLRLTRSRLQAVGRTAAGLAFEMPAWTALLLMAGLAIVAVPSWRQASTFAVLHVAVTILVWGAATLAFHPHVPRAASATQAARPSWLHASLGLGAFAAAMFLVTGGDLFVVGTLLSAQETGRYAVVARTSALALTVLQPIQLVAAPRLAQAWTAGDRLEVERIGNQCLRSSVALGATFVVAFWAFGVPLLRVFGAEYEGALWALRWVALAQVAAAVVGPLGLVLRMVHQERAALLVLAATLVVAVPASIFGTQIAGIAGAGVVRAAVLLLVAVGFHLLLVRRTGLRLLPWPRRALVAP